MPITPKHCKKPNMPRATRARWMNTDNVNMKFYNSKAWRTLSKTNLQRNPLCAECLKRGETIPADHSDHIKPIEQGGAALDPANVQSLCRPCHSIKTAKEKRNNK